MVVLLYMYLGYCVANSPVQLLDHSNLTGFIPRVSQSVCQFCSHVAMSLWV